MSRRPSAPSRLPAPYLKRVWLDSSRIPDRQKYPFNLPFLGDDFEIAFEQPVTIIVGENGAGKSTLIEAIAAVAGFGAAGGNRNHAAADAAGGLEVGGDELARTLRASWLPKIGSGWFFRAESPFSLARYLDITAIEDPFGGPPPDYLSHSHGEGFLRVIEERCLRQGVYLLDEPESALSPARQLRLLRLLRRMDESRHCQVIMATHSPLLMAYPGARLLRLDRQSLAPVRLVDTDHFRLLSEFYADPEGFVEEALAAPDD